MLMIIHNMLKGDKVIQIIIEVILFISPKKYRQAWHEISLKPQYKCAEVPQSSISMHLFSVFSSISRISQLSGY